MTVTSVCQPLGTVVGKLSSNPAQIRSAFWLWRRTKTLEDFVPLHDESRRAMIRGFAVARMMGYITADPAHPVKISTATGTVDFPFPLLTHVSQNNILPALLEAFPLTLAAAPTRQVAAFDAYKRLHQLGVRQGATYSLPEEVTKFVSDGVRSCQPVDQLAAERVGGATSEERKAAMITYLEANLARYRQIAAEPLTGQECRDQYGAVHPEDTLSRELIDDLTAGFEDVKSAIAAFGTYVNVV
jgi:hypothetical protein